MPTLAEPYFDRLAAHRAQCAACKGAKSYEDPRLCRVGAAMVRSWLEAEIRFGNPNVRRVPGGESA